MSGLQAFRSIFNDAGFFSTQYSIYVRQLICFCKILHFAFNKQLYWAKFCLLHIISKGFKILEEGMKCQSTLTFMLARKKNNQRELQVMEQMYVYFTFQSILRHFSFSIFIYRTGSTPPSFTDMSEKRRDFLRPPLKILKNIER